MDGLQELYELDELRLSHSSVQLFKSCARKYEFSKLLRMSNMGEQENRYAADTGGALHIATQVYAITRDIDLAIYALLLHYPYNEIPDQTNSRSVWACIETLKSIARWWDYSGYELVEIRDANGNVRPGVEVSFKIEFPPIEIGDRLIPVSFIGFIDLIVRPVGGGPLAAIDLKTSRTKTTDLLEERYKFMDQINPYGRVLEVLIPEYKQPDGTLKGSYVHAYVDLVESDVVEMPVYKTHADLADWYVGVVMAINNIKNFAKLNWFPRDGSSCVNWKRSCRFFDICHTRDKDRMKLYKKQYQHDVISRGGKLELPPFEPMITTTIEIVGV